MWEVLVLGFFADVLNVWETVGPRTGGCGMETCGVEAPDDASSSASSSSSIAASDLSVTLLFISSSDKRLSEACRADVLGRPRFAGGFGGIAGLRAGEFCVYLAGLGQVVDPAAMVNGLMKGGGLFDGSEVLSLDAMVLRKVR